MSTYRMDDGTVVRTENATQSWDEGTYFDGKNHISKATGGQWNHQRLYRSRKGRYYVVHWSQWQGSRAGADWVDNLEAVRWLLTNGHSLPDELASYEAEIAE